MPNFLAGPGQSLAVPQNLYPSALFNAPLDVGTNTLGLAPGDSIALPAGDWLVDNGRISLIQYLDPVQGIWRGFNSAHQDVAHYTSDGFNVRVANLTGCPVAAQVTAGGTGWVQSSTTVTSNSGGSTWAPIVGGAITTSSITSAFNAGSPIGGLNFGVAPILFLPLPPVAQSSNAPVTLSNAITAPLGGFGGVPASGYTTISNTSVSAVSIQNVGAGYTGTTLAAVILPNPYDPNLASTTAISQATCYFNLGFNGQITAVLCTNNGAPTAAPALTAAGAGSGATISAVNMTCLTGISVTNGGAGWNNLATELSTVNGRPGSTSAIANPAIDLSTYIPRKASVQLNSTSAGVVSLAAVIVDPGLFVGTPTVLLSGNTVPTSAATIGLTLGGLNDYVILQPSP